MRSACARPVYTLRPAEPLPFHTTLLAVLPFTLLAFVQDGPPPFEEAGLRVAPPTLEVVETQHNTSEQVRVRWSGSLGEARVEVLVRVLSLEEYEIQTPEEVRDVCGGSGFGKLSEEFAYLQSATWGGHYGTWSFAAVGHGQLVKATGRTDFLCLAGVIGSDGYAIQIEIEPVDHIAAFDEMLRYLERAVTYSGPPPDPKWTDAEAEARWNAHAGFFSGDLEIRRTKHYIILTNSSGGKLFGKKLEEAYEEIRDVFPFNEDRKRRLMPILLFRTEDQYVTFSASATSLGYIGARQTKGHAKGDYYATWYDAPGDPVHIHEATHQIFTSILGLKGGGRWFQEGVATYMSSRSSERDQAAGRLKTGKDRTIENVVFESFFRMDHTSYLEAALVVEFCRESRFAKERFDEFLRAMGSLEFRPDTEAEVGTKAVMAAFEQVYGVAIDDLNAEFATYCKKR